MVGSLLSSEPDGHESALSREYAAGLWHTTSEMGVLLVGTT